MKTCLLFPMLAIFGFLGGCRAVGPDYQKPELPLLAAGNNAAKIESEWWKNFHDNTLTDLIQTARTTNLDLAAAEAHIREARALARSAELGNYSASLRNSAAVATWELDLFGKLRRGKEAAHASVEVAEAVRDAALVSVSAEVAVAYLDFRGSQQMTALTSQMTDSLASAQQLSQQAESLGRATRLETDRFAAQLAESRATLPLLRQEQENAIARLVVLTGQSHSTLAQRLEKIAPVPVVPETMVVGLPPDLLRHRPDVRSAERELGAAVAEIGVETADLYPSLSLGGSLSYSVGEPSGILWNGGPSLSWAALDLPRVRSSIDAAQARADSALARYKKTVLQAAEEATTALSAWQNQRERRAQLRQSVALAKSLSVQTKRQMEAGVLTFPAVLGAEKSYLEAEKQFAESDTAVATSLVAVYQALGGGWKR